MAPGIYGFDHIVVRLKDLDAGIAAYTKMFPKGPRQVGENPAMGLKMAFFDLPNGPRQVGENPAMGLKMAFFDLPNGGFVELVAPNGPKSVLLPALEKNGPGMNLMAFQCEDLPATVKMMKDNGVRLIEDDPTHIMVHPKSTHGILMQLVEKSPNATRATKEGQVPDTSGVKGIVSYKCTVVFVKDADEAIASYKKLGLRLHFNIENKRGGIRQCGFFLKGGGMIELIGPLDPKNENDGFVKMMKTRGEGFKHISLDASAGALDVLSAAGVRARKTDPEHADLHKDATLTPDMLFQLNPVGMGTKAQVDLGQVMAKL